MRRRWIGFAVIALLTGGPVAADPPQRPSPIAGIVAQAASRAGIPEAWIWSVMRVESGGDLHAVSRAGAMGLMQLMPATWSDLRTRLALGDDPFDPHDNVLAGATYLRAMHDRYGEPGFLAAYNAGPARYEEYLLRHRPLPAETTHYVRRLAPIVGTGSLPDPLAWTRATLFVGSAKDGLVPPVGDAGSKVTDTSTAEARPSASLFVRISTAAHP
ncbi:lytic transglycosylase domain-containing protein [Sphingomonas oryzagri]